MGLLYPVRFGVFCALAMRRAKDKMGNRRCKLACDRLFDRLAADAATGTDAGTYYVWYMAKGDNDHSDSAAACCTVTIAGSGEENKSGFKAENNVGDLEVSKMNVNGMDTLAKESTADGSTYEMKVSGKSYDEVVNNGGSQIKAKAQSMYRNLSDLSNLKELFLDISIFKIKDQTQTKITSTKNVIEMIFPFDMTDKFSPVFWRYHGNNAQAFSNNESKKDGTFYVEGAGVNAKIHTFSSEYSTFALTYSTTQVELVNPDSNSTTSVTPPTAESASPKQDTGTSYNPFTWITGTSSSSSGSGSSETPDLKVTGKGSSKGNYYKNGKGTVAYHSPAVSAKTKHITVPDTVKIGKKTYKVTEIVGYAFVGYDKLTTVTLGKNIKKLDKNAFGGAVKLRVVRIKTTKLTKKKIKGCFADSKVDTVIILKPAHGKFKYYKKIFTQKITGSAGALTVKKSKKNK